MRMRRLKHLATIKVLHRVLFGKTNYSVLELYDAQKVYVQPKIIEVKWNCEYQNSDKIYFFRHAKTRSFMYKRIFSRIFKTCFRYAIDSVWDRRMTHFSFFCKLKSFYSHNVNWYESVYVRRRLRLNQNHPGTTDALPAPYQDKKNKSTGRIFKKLWLFLEYMNFVMQRLTFSLSIKHVTL